MSRARARAMGWRRLLLLPIALLASLVVVVLARTLAQTPDLDARWRLDSSGHLLLMATDLPWLHGALGHSLQTVVAPGEPPLVVDGRSVVNSTRWIADDEQRRGGAAPAARDGAHREAGRDRAARLHRWPERGGHAARRAGSRRWASPSGCSAAWAWRWSWSGSS